MVLDLDDLVVRWNAGMERLYGLSKVAAVGQDIKDLFDEAFVSQLRQARENFPDGLDVLPGPTVFTPFR